MRRTLPTALVAGSRTLRCHALAASLMLGAAIAFAQTPPARETVDPAKAAAAADAALVARASALVLKREIARLRAAETLETDHKVIGRARLAASTLISRAAAVAPVAAGWTWGLTGEMRDEPMALCLPNGALVVSDGLMQKMSLSDPELAAILAHVIGHQLSGADAREALAIYRRQRDTPDPDPNRATAELADILGKLILSPRYDAAAEKEADALALELLARSGVDPAAAASAWRKVAQSESTRAPGLLAFHATPPERIADIEARAAALQPLYETALADMAAAPKPAQRPKHKLPARKSMRPPPG